MDPAKILIVEDGAAVGQIRKDDNFPYRILPRFVNAA